MPILGLIEGCEYRYKNQPIVFFHPPPQGLQLAKPSARQECQ